MFLAMRRLAKEVAILTGLGHCNCLFCFQWDFRLRILKQNMTSHGDAADFWQLDFSHYTYLPVVNIAIETLPYSMSNCQTANHCWKQMTMAFPLRLYTTSQKLTLETV